MSQYEPYPTGPDGQGAQYGNQYGNPPGVRGPRPASVDLAIKLIYAGVALSVVSTVVQFFSLDALIEAQAQATPELSESVLRTTAIITLVVVLAVGTAIALLFAYFIGKGANWARIVYTVLTVLSSLFGLLGLAALPVLPLLLSLLGLVLTVVVLVLLYRSDSNAWFASR